MQKQTLQIVSQLPKKGMKIVLPVFFFFWIFVGASAPSVVRFRFPKHNHYLFGTNTQTEHSNSELEGFINLCIKTGVRFAGQSPFRTALAKSLGLLGVLQTSQAGRSFSLTWARTPTGHKDQTQV